MVGCLSSAQLVWARVLFLCVRLANLYFNTENTQKREIVGAMEIRGTRKGRFNMAVQWLQGAYNFDPKLHSETFKNMCHLQPEGFFGAVDAPGHIQ
jgi:hypothetical protein